MKIFIIMNSISPFSKKKLKSIDGQLVTNLNIKTKNKMCNLFKN